ncbi:MAG: methyl-accepting chemotaxis protein [Roseburia sp.]|nr:methyl-accepting chemotaxis protein [Ruminococcus sp.]MCM1154741.1 methyl-accepting chemotaxis protein [Roseburia sp.]MCM1243509.1 methyl-accepting chemotaxis protein [Roseburia sp.]
MNGGKKQTHVSVPVYRQLRTRLIASFMIPVLCIIILGVVSYQRASRAIITSYEESVRQTMNMTNQYITLAINTVRSNYNSYVADTDLANYFKGLFDESRSDAVYSSFQNTLSQEVNANSLIDNIFLISDDMPSITSNEPPETALFTAYSQTAEGAQVVEQRSAYHMFGNLCEADAALGTDSSNYAFRIAKYMSSSKAILLVDLDREIIMNSLATLESGGNGYVALITQDGTEFYSDGTSARNSVFTSSDFYAAAAEQEESGMQYVTYNGESYLFLYSPLAAQSTMICMLIPREIILEQAAGIKTVAVTLVILAVIVAALLGSFISSHINSNIYYILKQLKVIADGDLTARIKSKSKDEFKLLAEGVNSMTDSMKSLITNVTAASDSLNHAAERVSASSETFVNTAEDIQNAISEIESGVTQLDENSADCLTQMDTLSGKISDVTDDTRGIIDLTQSTSNSINEGISSMSVLTDSAKKTSEITDNVITAIEALSDKSRSIGQIVESINSIARETNLLSLNASIEAARAGESGRGFAVVAEQIRQLADQSAQSAGQIQVIIDDIVKTTSDVVEIAKEAESTVEFQEKAVAQTTDSFLTMDKQIHTLLDSISTISESIQNMESARSNTLNAIESISSISAETSAGSANVSETVTAQRDAIQTLDAAAGILQERAGELAGLLHRFVI